MNTDTIVQKMSNTKSVLLGKWKCSCGSEGKKWLKVWRAQQGANLHLTTKHHRDKSYTIVIVKKKVKDLLEEGEI